MRRLNVAIKQPLVLQTVKEFDAFPKVPDGFQETTATGGFVTLVVVLATVVLIYFEVTYYTSSDIVFSYDVDNDINEKLKINVDLVVAMKCGHIGADVLDMTGENQATFGRLEETPVYFTLTQKQLEYFQMTRMVNTYLRTEYHALHQLLWKTGYGGWWANMPQREEESDHPPDGCRLNGTLTVNKVAGNFHITAGRSIDFGAGAHMHLAMDHRAGNNFSHRILHLSFGDVVPGIVSPLDGEEKIVNESSHVFQYFIQVVPTKVKMRHSPEVNTFQFAVTEENRTIDHNRGSHGMPGIFVRYDLSSLRIIVQEHHKSYWRFLVRLCGIIGGIYATSGVLHGVYHFLFDLACCHYGLGKYRSRKTMPLKSAPVPEVAAIFPQSDDSSKHNLLIDNFGPSDNNKFVTAGHVHS